MFFSRVRALVGVCSLAAVSACVTTQDWPPPTTSLAGAICETVPFLKAGEHLPYEGKAVDLEFQLTSASPCLRLDGQDAALYKAFVLPRTGQEYRLKVAAYLQGTSILAPRLLLYTENGKLVRRYDAQKFLFRSGGTSAWDSSRTTEFGIEIRGRTDEYYLVVTSDPEIVGKSRDRIETDVNVTGVMVGTGYVPIYTGSEDSQQFVFSHTGAGRIRISPLPRR